VVEAVAVALQGADRGAGAAPGADFGGDGGQHVLLLDQFAQVGVEPGSTDAVAHQRAQLAVVHGQDHAGGTAGTGDGRAQLTQFVHAQAGAAMAHRHGGRQQAVALHGVHGFLREAGLGVHVCGVNGRDVLCDELGGGEQFVEGAGMTLGVHGSACGVGG
jgi:hypothetical protein